MRLAFIVCLFSLSLAASPSRAWAWIETAAAYEPLPNPPAQPPATLLPVSSMVDVPGPAAVLYRLECSGGSCRLVPLPSSASPVGTAAPLRGRVRERSVVVTRRVVAAPARVLRRASAAPAQLLRRAMPVRGLLKARPVRGLLGGLCRRGGCG